MTSKSGDAAQPTPEEVLAEVSRKMDRSVEALRQELASLRTGRATPSLVENMMIDYYGSPTPLKQIASISAPDPQAILVQPWDKQSLRDIERGLIKSDMGFNPSNDGNNITVPIPAQKIGASQLPQGHPVGQQKPDVKAAAQQVGGCHQGAATLVCGYNP